MSVNLIRTSCLVVFLLLTLEAQSSSCDEIIPIGQGGDKTAEKRAEPIVADTSQKAETIHRYFDQEGISLGESLDVKFTERYDQEVVDKMSELLEKKSVRKSYALNAEINGLIYKKLMRAIKSAEAPLRPVDEVVLQALDLIVPDSPSEPLYRSAKLDLRAFVSEQAELGRELLERVGVLLDSSQLHTQPEAIDYLTGFYYNWIPLGRLTKFIETSGSSESAHSS